MVNLIIKQNFVRVWSGFQEHVAVAEVDEVSELRKSGAIKEAQNSEHSSKWVEMNYLQNSILKKYKVILVKPLFLCDVSIRRK